MMLDKERDRATSAYNVGEDCEIYWTRAKATHHACIMPAFDTNDRPINPDHFAKKLVGALCEVTFTFKHYAIGVPKKEGGQAVEAHDIFSAQVETIAVLKNPPPMMRSPYKGQLTKRPHHRAQIPTRREQVNAATAFKSRRNIGSTSTLPADELATASPAPSISTLVSDDGKAEDMSNVD